MTDAANRSLAAVALFIALALPGAAAEDSFRATLHLDSLDGETGGGGELDWLQRPRQPLRWFLGASVFSLSETSWGYGRVGLVHPIRGRVVGRSEVHLGTGERNGSSFPYRIVRSEASSPLGGSFLVTGSLQWIDVDTISGVIAGAGATWNWSAATSIGLQTFGSLSSNLDTEWVSARLDHAFGDYHLLTGVSHGRSRPELEIPIDGTDDTAEFFAGIGFSDGHTLLARFVETGEVSRFTVSVSWRFGS